MNGAIFFPKFLEGEPLPKGYFEPVAPFKEPLEWNVDIRGLAKYAETKGVHIAEISKEEYNQFKK